MPNQAWSRLRGLLNQVYLSLPKLPSFSGFSESLAVALKGDEERQKKRVKISQMKRFIQF